MIAVTEIEGKGRGLVAMADIQRGQLLSAAPITRMPAGALDNTPLENHCWRLDGEDCLAWGAQTLCNHADEPNCVSVLHDETDLLISIRQITKGEELTLNYFDFEE